MTEMPLTLQKTYHRMGFFNVPVSHERFFGQDGEVIHIDFGGQHTEGSINRRCNLNHTPRIMGYVPLRDWLQKHYASGDTLTVTIRNPNHIVIG